jgi:hypothetical protein
MPPNGIEEDPLDRRITISAVFISRYGSLLREKRD